MGFYHTVTHLPGHNVLELYHNYTHLRSNYDMNSIPYNGKQKVFLMSNQLIDRLCTLLSKFFFTMHFKSFRKYEGLIGKSDTFVGDIEGEGN
jgi:hypothetical protein